MMLGYDAGRGHRHVELFHGRDLLLLRSWRCHSSGEDVQDVVAVRLLSLLVLRRSREARTRRSISVILRHLQLLPAHARRLRRGVPCSAREHRLIHVRLLGPVDVRRCHLGC